MQRFACVHGHFYQPPREDPWTGRVSEEGSASPYHDWNERVTAECYAPNAEPLVRLPGAPPESNYTHMSFDFGPTLLRWLESEHPELHKAVVDADRTSEGRNGGHGSAMAQVYNHMIMPLASAEDRRVQTRWGVEDFERRFHRFPEGMWLPETAADLPSLEALADAGIKFTVLAPHQASAVRPLRGGEWVDVSGGAIDTRKAYLCRLPSGKTISVFFFDWGLSRGPSFARSLESGASLSGAINSRFTGSDEPELVSIATDGEDFGHHRKNAERALAECISLASRSKAVTFTSYASFLSLVPPTHEVKIVDGTSWSCPHGVERWRSDCGCASEIREGFDQAWRGPLRRSMDWLGARIGEAYDSAGAAVFSDPVEARDMLPSIRMTSDQELFAYARGRVKHGEQADRGVRLLKMARCSGDMLASCAWFWEDLWRLETVQGLRLAARAIELAREAGWEDLGPGFSDLLSGATSNEPTRVSGAGLYARVARGGRS